MLNAIKVLNYDFNVPMPILTSIGKKVRSNVSNITEPVKDTVLTATIKRSSLDLRPAVFVYTVHFQDEKPREIFAPVGSAGVEFKKTFFLNEGRTSGFLKEIKKLKINNPKDQPSHVLIQRLKVDSQARNKQVQARYRALYSLKHS